MHLSSFQFHGGSIKGRRVIAAGIGCWIWFQFHGGSIKGQCTHGIMRRFLCFNSTVVRLKECPILSPPSSISSFQFHGGSIKGRSGAAGVGRAGEFQFHGGSIKGCWRRPHRSRNYSRFQFHGGSIKGSRSTAWAESIVSSFNSTVVRLKESTGSSTLVRAYEFQFHGGSIKG